MTVAATDHITREDIEAKFRELRGEVDEATSTARQYALIGGAVVAVGLVAAAYWLGRRRSQKQTTLVEVKRL